MEGGLSDRALKVLRAALHEKVGMNLDEMPNPKLVAAHISVAELASQPNCGRTTLAEIHNWMVSQGYNLRRLSARH
jgi:hypothetical protein